MACERPVVVRGMTSAVREAAHAWIRREPPHQSFEHRMPWPEHVHIVRCSDIMLYDVRFADTSSPRGIDQDFFAGPCLAAGDFGLSRCRYDSPSITRS